MEMDLVMVEVGIGFNYLFGSLKWVELASCSQFADIDWLLPSLRSDCCGVCGGKDHPSDEILRVFPKQHKRKIFCATSSCHLSRDWKENFHRFYYAESKHVFISSIGKTLLTIFAASHHPTRLTLKISFFPTEPGVPFAGPFISLDLWQADNQPPIHPHFNRRVSNST